MSKTSLANHLFILGIFLLIWATDAYLIFGSIGKFGALCCGFLSIILSVLLLPIKKRHLQFTLITFLIYLLLLFIAVLQKQNTLYPQLVIFSIICFSLLNSGYLFSKSIGTFEKIDPYIYVILTTLTIAGAYFFYKNQSAIINLNLASRELGDDSLNPISVAYSHSLLFLFLFWLSLQTNNKKIKIYLIIGLASTFMVIISTLSRGAILYLVLTLLFSLMTKNIGFRIIVSKKKILNILSLFTIIFVAIIIIKQIPVFEYRISTLSHRFISLLNFIDSSQKDYSAMERMEMYDSFFTNWTHYLLGQHNYTPYPHNQYLEIFMRWGLLGIPIFIFSISIFIKSFKVLCSKTTKSPILLLCTFLFFFSYLQSMSSMSLEMNRMMWLGFGFIFGTKNITKNLIRA